MTHAISVPYLPFGVDYLQEDAAKGERSTLWNIAPVHLLIDMDNCGSDYRTECQLAYSMYGIHIAVNCRDRLISCSGPTDFADLFREDVVEVFLWPDRSQFVYFEYEISPLGSELPLLVSNRDGCFMGWLPWHYEGERRVRKRVVVAGDARAGGTITSWAAEIFVPFPLLAGLGNVPPRPGQDWYGNVYRMDYDGGICRKWSLFPVTDGEFHNYWEFGTLEFFRSTI